jgi:hypothetical protein
MDYDLGGRHFSRAEREALSKLVQAEGETVSARPGASLSARELEAAGLSRREVAELLEKLAAPALQDFELDLARMRSAEEVAREMERAVPGNFE